MTKGTAADHSAWVKRGAGHPLVLAALATRAITKSYAREICWWTDKLPEDARQAADEILLGAAASGLELPDLAGLAGEMYEKSRQDKPDTDPGDSDGGDGGDPDAGFDDRSVKLATTIGGAGVMHGALTPECAEFVKTVLDALSAPAGADDDRTHEQRYHDALQEAMSRLIAAGLAPQRGGQPVRVWAYISLADLMQLEGSAELAQEWIARLAAQWAGHRTAAAEAGGHQGLWLNGDAAQGIACGAPVTPVVVGNVNPAAFGDLIRLCAQLDKLLHGPAGSEPGEGQPDEDQPRVDQPGSNKPGVDQPGDSETGAVQARAVPRRRPQDPSCLRKRCSRPSSARPSSCSPARVAWPVSCAATSVSGRAAPACRWTSATARPSPCRSATRSGSGTSTASGQAGAASPPQRAKCTTPGTRPTAGRPASKTASCSVPTTTRS